MKYEEAVRRCVDALGKNQCMVLVGAGLSAWNSPSSRPDTQLDQPLSTDGLRRELLRRIDDEVLRTSLEGDDLAAVAQALTDRNKHRTLAECIRDHVAKGRPNELHSIIADIGFPAVVTTNYDTCLEAAYRRAGREYRSVATDETLMEGGLFSPLILHLHGRAESGRDLNTEAQIAEYLRGLVLTERQYWDFPETSGAKRQLMCDYLRLLIASHTTLIVGYGLRDFNFIEQLHRLAPMRAHMAPSIAIVKDGDERLARRWETRGVFLVEYDQGGFLWELWRAYFGVDYAQATSDAGGTACQASRQATVAANVLLSYAGRGNDSCEMLRRTVNERAFPGRLLRKVAESSSVDGAKLLDLCVGQRWLRPVSCEPSDDVVQADEAFYEFDIDVRLAVRGRLKMRDVLNSRVSR
jgi:hypothetical protein